MQVIKDMEQGSPEWFAVRLGVITASNFKLVMAGGKGATRKNYMLKLASEIITGLPAETFTNEYMEWGTKTEPQARAMYEFETGSQVDQVAFIKHDTMAAGCSPDGLVNGSGLLEIKCPKTTTHIETVLSDKMPSHHMPQVQGQMWISGREWCDFVSFDPRINGRSGFFRKRILRDQKYIDDLAYKVKLFEKELLTIVEELQ